MINITNQVLDFIIENKACFYSDIARKFNISIHTVKDLVKLLEKQNKISIQNKGIAKLVIFNDQRKR